MLPHSPHAPRAPRAPHAECLQEKYAAKSICFGCGPANEKGLRIRSHLATPVTEPVTEPVTKPDEIVAEWDPEPHHAAFPGVLNGGIIGALLDCHSNWTASYQLMKAGHLDSPPCTVTAEFHVTLKRPTPMSRVRISARVIAAEGAQGDRVTVEAELRSVETGKVTATCRGTFVAVREDHPAHHRW